MLYEPDKFVILKIRIDGILVYRVLGSWFGGFTAGDSWRINSGITEYQEEFCGNLLITGTSGSIYRVHKECEGMSMYTACILQGWQEKVKDLEVISLETFKKEFKRV